jgi:hypothetical protein
MFKVRGIPVVAIVTTLWCAPVAAQLDPAMIAQGQVLSGTARGYAERGGVRDDGGRGSPEKTARICGQVPKVRARLGAKNPRYLELARLCRKAGYP